MEKLKVRLVLSLVLCACIKGFYITFYNHKMSWKNATTFCFSKGGILESNETITKQRAHCGSDGLWMGSFEAYTPYATIFGCIKYMHGIIPSKVQPGDYRQCQRLCPEDRFEFFTVKGSLCYCLNGNSLKWEDFENCIDNTNVDNAGDSFFTIYKQKIESDEDGLSITIGNMSNDVCLAAQCRPNTGSNILILSRENCGAYYKTICQNDSTVPRNTNQSDSEKKCKERNSYIKWYTQREFCSNSGNMDNTAPHWTGAKQVQTRFNLTLNDNNTDMEPLACRKYHTGDNIFKFVANCDQKLSFFCGFNHTNVSKPTASQPCNFPSSNDEQKGDQTTGAVVGSVVSVIVLAAIILGLFIYRRRLITKFPKLSHLVGKDNVTPNNQQNNFPRDSVVLNPNYSLPNPLKMEGKLSDDHSTGIQDFVVKIKENENRKQQLGNTYDTPKNLKHSYNNYNDIDITDGRKETEETTDYSFATPINEEDSDPYTTNKDYDRLHNVKKKENPNHKVYDHLPAAKESDPTYDHTNLNIATTSDGDYDHFSAKS